MHAMDMSIIKLWKLTNESSQGLRETETRKQSGGSNLGNKRRLELPLHKVGTPSPRSGDNWHKLHVVHQIWCLVFDYI